MRISYGNLLDDATLTVSTGTENTGDYQKAGLTDGFLQPELRVTPDTGAVAITADAGDGETLTANVCRICAFNDADNITVKIQANSEDVWTSPPVDVTLTLSGRHGVARFAASEEYRYWRLLITGVTTSYLRIGEWQLALDSALPVAYTDKSDAQADLAYTDASQTEGGQWWSYVHYQITRWPRLEWRDLTSAEWDTFAALHAACKGRGAFWFVLDDADQATEAANTYFCAYLTDDLSKEPAQPNFYHTVIAAEEVAEGIYYD